MDTAFATNGEELQVWQAPKVEEIGIMGGPLVTTTEFFFGNLS